MEDFELYRVHLQSFEDEVDPNGDEYYAAGSISHVLSAFIFNDGAEFVCASGSPEYISNWCKSLNEAVKTLSYDNIGIEDMAMVALKNFGAMRIEWEADPDEEYKSALIQEEILLAEAQEKRQKFEAKVEAAKQRYGANNSGMYYNKDKETAEEN